MSGQGPSSPGRPAADRSSLRWVLALTSVAFFMVALDVLVLSTALPTIQRELRAGILTLQWTVNAYGLVFASGIITAAALGDRFGRRRVFAAGLALFSLSSAACALAPSAGALIVARGLQGLGAAIIMPISLTILTGAFPAERRGAVVGMWGGIAGLAVATGPLVGGAVTQGVDWHWIFWVNVPIGLVGTVLSFLRLPESYGPATRMDLPAVGLVSAGAAGLVWGLARTDEVGWRSTETVASVVLGTALLAAFLAWEHRSPAPMLPLRLFRSLTFTAAVGTGFLMIASLTAAAFLVSQYLQVVQGFSPLAAGLRILPWTATPMLISPLAGTLADRVGTRTVMAGGVLLQALGLGWLGLLGTAGAAYPSLVLPLVVAGVGISLAMPSVPTAALGAVRPVDMGKASGVNSTLQRFGGVFGLAIATAVFAANGHLGTAAGFSAGFRPALIACAAFSVLGACTALAVHLRPRAVPADPLEREAAA